MSIIYDCVSISASKYYLGPLLVLFIADVMVSIIYYTNKCFVEHSR